MLRKYIFLSVRKTLAHFFASETMDWSRVEKRTCRRIDEVLLGGVIASNRLRLFRLFFYSIQYAHVAHHTNARTHTQRQLHKFHLTRLCIRFDVTEIISFGSFSDPMRY